MCLVALVAVAGACTSDPVPTPVDPNSVAADLAGTKPGQAPVPSERCSESGNSPVTKVVLTTSDKVHLAGARFGTGTKGVLLLPQRLSDLCPWWDFASELVNKGYLVLAIDMRGTGYSEDAKTMDYTADAAAGIAELKRAGAQKVVLIGASQGAATALVTAGRMPDQIAGVVSLSYPDDNLDVTGGTGAQPHTPLQAAALITSPLLIAFTSGDRQAAKPDDLVAKVPGPAKQLVGRSGVSHGWDMLKIGQDDVRPDVQTFLTSYA